MRRRYTVTDGIVIRRKPLPSGDVVVTLLNQDGKWRAVARKGKLPGGNLGRLSLFHDVRVQYYRKRDEDLALLTQVTLNGALPRLALPNVYPYAHLLAELADELTVDVHLGERVYDYLASGLRGLNVHADPDLVSLVYAWRLLRVAGLAPRVTTCALCGTAGELVAFDVAAGGCTCSDCRSGTTMGHAALAELQLLVGAPATAALARGCAGRATQWRLLERYVAFHVRELRSFEAAAAARPDELPLEEAGHHA